MSADKYPSIFSRQMATIVYIVSRYKHGLSGDRLLVIHDENETDKRTPNRPTSF